MYKCSKNRIFFVCLRQIVFYYQLGSKSVTIVECVNQCIVQDYAAMSAIAKFLLCAAI